MVSEMCIRDRALGGERGASDPHPGKPDWFGRERDRLVPHHRQPGELRIVAGQQVQGHPRTEPGGADPQSGVSDGIRDSATQGSPEERGEPRGRVDDAGPPVGESEADQLRKDREEVPREQLALIPI